MTNTLMSSFIIGYLLLVRFADSAEPLSDRYRTFWSTCTPNQARPNLNDLPGYVSSERQQSAGISPVSRAVQILAKRERISLYPGIEEIDLEADVFDWSFLPDELVHPRLPNFARAIGAGIRSMIIARSSAIE